jgi:glycosyltransferase involved in cell wall biosynthesis
LTFLTNKKIIFLTKTNWDYYLHPYRTLYAKELANLGNNVFWINEPTKNPFKFLLFLFINQYKNNVRIFTPFLLTPTLLQLNWVNSAILSLQLFWICGKLNSDETILWSVYCSHYHFIRRYGKAYKIYWPGDLFEIQKEQETIKAYDLVMPLCEESVKEVNEFYSGKTFLSTTGCDWELFDSAYEERNAKEFLSENNRRIVGYVGNISAFRLDFELISEIVCKCKDLDFVFAGPVEKDRETQDWIMRLNLFKNIKFTGEIDYQDVPKLIDSFTVGIIPYKLNSFNLGTNPNKFFEYSAMAVPCVSTEIPSLRKFLPYIRISNNSDSLHKHICEAINDGKENSKKLRSIAFNSSPASSLKRIEMTIVNSSA